MEKLAPAPFSVEDWTRYDVLFQKHAVRYGIDWKMLKAIALKESSLGTDPRVAGGRPSRDGKSWGLMQVTLPTATWLAGRQVTPQDLNDPDFSVALAAKYLRMLEVQFNSDERKVVMSYNQGQGNTMAGKTFAQFYYECYLENLEIVKRYSPL